ncbi:MAG: STAS domain-containing protein [candidate division Zixibacteria bacterium]
MKIADREDNGIVVLELKGNIMGGDDEAVFYDKLRELIEQNKKKVVLDLAKVEWINSRGLGILISGLTTMRNNKGQLKIARVAEKVESLLTMTRLITVFDSYDTVDEAVASFAG